MNNGLSDCRILLAKSEKLVGNYKRVQNIQHELQISDKTAQYMQGRPFNTQVKKEFFI